MAQEHPHPRPRPRTGPGERRARPATSRLGLGALGLSLLFGVSCTDEVFDPGPPTGSGAQGMGGAGTGAAASTNAGGTPGAGGSGAADDAALTNISRLTRVEYSATIAAALGIEPDVDLIPEDGRVGRFTSNVGVTPDPVHPYLLLAEELALAAIPTAPAGCESTDVDACLDEELRPWLELLFRRPLAESELPTWSLVMQEVLDGGGDATDATRAALGAALLSPDFLFRSSPSNAGENAWARRIAEWLAYVLWDGPPDEELLQAVGGNTGLAAELQGQAARLSLDARATPTLARFLGQWLDVDTDLRKDESDTFETSPDYLELLAFVEEAMASGRPVKDFIGGAFGLVHPDNAELYGVDGTLEEVTLVDWEADSFRRGLLAQELLAGSTRHPDPGRRPIFRGLLVRRELLCEKLPLPDPELVALAGEVEDRTTDERCRTCHQHIDPIGYAFAALDPDFAGEPPEANILAHDELAGTYANVAQLLEAVAASRSFAECFSRQWLAFFLEEELDAVSDSWVASLADSVEAGASLGTVVEEAAFELAVRSESALPWCAGE